MTIGPRYNTSLVNSPVKESFDGVQQKSYWWEKTTFGDTTRKSYWDFKSVEYSGVGIRGNRILEEGKIPRYVKGNE